MQREIHLNLSSEIPTKITPRSSNFIDFSPTEVARQLTLLEFENYRNIHPSECLNQSWVKKNKAEVSPNIGKMIYRSNIIPFWVATQILTKTEQKIKNRAKMIENFIKIAAVILFLKI